MVRRLAAIMFTDLVGSTQLAQKDERAALALLREQSALAGPLLAVHGGRLVKSTGDGMLIEFANARDAVEYSVAFQRAVEQRNGRDGVTPLRVRIGIHVGDVESQGTDILGDAVNVAARIEPLAEPGGICLSGTVYEQTHNKVAVSMERIGPTPLKGVTGTVEIYRIVLPWQRAEVATSPEPDRTRIVVLPFANMSPDPNDEYFADGMTEELIDRLAQVKEMQVIARTSAMTYKKKEKNVREIAKELSVGSLVEGSIRKAGNRIRVTAQLINGSTEAHLWSSRFDGSLDDIFAVQSEIAEKVTEELKIRLVRSEKRALEKKPTENMEAYSAYLRARGLWNLRATESVREALSVFQQATSMDPRFAQAYSGIADCYSVLVDRSEMPFSEGTPRAMVAALRAIELNSTLPEPHASLALVQVSRYEWAAAETGFRRAIELSPSYASAHHWLALLLTAMGRLEEAQTEAALAEDADPLSPVILFGAGSILAARHHLDEAMAKWKRALEHGAGLADFILLGKGLFCAAARRTIEAHAARTELEALRGSGDGRNDMDRTWFLALLDGVLGRAEPAQAALKTLLPMAERGEVRAGRIAALYAVLGELDRFFEWLDRSIDEHSQNLATLRVSPIYEPARADPRFAAALLRIGLPG